MNIHEYQAKALLHEFGVPISKGVAVLRAADADGAAKALPGPIWVVKSQIHAGGRGKGKFKESLRRRQGRRADRQIARRGRAFAKQMLGATLVTVQTGPHGKQVNRLYVEEGSDIDKEFYLSILVNRETCGSVVRGLDRRRRQHRGRRAQHAGKDRDLLGRSCDRHHEPSRPHRRQGLGPVSRSGKTGGKAGEQLYAAFVAKDMAMLEINPLVVTKQGQLRVLDAKVSFDDNALFRHPEVAALRDETEEDAKEIEASKYDLNYVTLDGNIGCMVNGAGLAMATMDIIKLYGMSPANFLDVGGGASKEKVAAAFKIITADPNVKGILVNIFGGIMKCDIIAEGVVAAVKEVGLESAAGGAPRGHQRRSWQADHPRVPASTWCRRIISTMPRRKS